MVQNVSRIEEAVSTLGAIGITTLVVDASGVSKLQARRTDLSHEELPWRKVASSLWLMKDKVRETASPASL